MADIGLGVGLRHDEPALGRYRAADGRALVAVAAVAVAADVVARVGLATLAATASLWCIAAGLLTSGRVRRPQAMAVAMAAPVVGTWLTLRASPWLVGPDSLAAGGLLVLAAALEVGGDLFDLDAGAWLRKLAAVFAPAIGGASFVAGGTWLLIKRRTAGRRLEASIPVLRGVVAAVPVVLLLGGLLWSADPVFASFLTLHLELGSVVLHVVAAALGAWAMGGLLRVASHVPSDHAGPGGERRLGMTEALVILGAVDILFGLFAIAQAVAAAGGADHVLRTSGLTYAEYARAGYFQLLWVAALALVLLVALDTAVVRSSRTARGAFGILGAAGCALTVVVTAAAFHRLSLYEDAFGLTMLRLSCQVFAVWITVVFALLAVSLLGAWPKREWFVGAAAVAGLVILFAFNTADPEALVARQALDRGPASDVTYVAGLSPDAVPAAIERIERLDPAAQNTYRSLVCTGVARADGWAAFNASAREGRRALARFCGLEAGEHLFP